MASEKKPSDQSKKSAAKKSPAKKAAKKPAANKAPAAEVNSPVAEVQEPVIEAKNPVAEKIAGAVPSTEQNLINAPMKTAQPSAAELYDEIRRRAYEFYRERGGQHGSHEADWHRAEFEVRSKYK